MNVRHEAGQPMQPLVAIEMEQAVLGGLLIDNSAVDRIDMLQAAHFSRADHRALFEAITALIRDGETADVITVVEQLRAAGIAEKVGGMPYLNALAQNTPGAANIARYAAIVFDRWRLREAHAAADQMLADVTNRSGTSVDDIVNRAQARLERLSDAQGTEARLIGEHFGDLVFDLGEQHSGRATVKAIPTGLRDLDRALGGGMAPGDLIILAGRPSMGKTACGMGVSEHVACSGPVLLASLEMSGQQLAMRFGARHSGISMARMKDGKKLDDADWPRITKAAESAARSQLYIDDRSALSLHDVQNAARRIKRRHGHLALLVIDYLGLLTGGNGDNRTQQIGSFTRGLKALAKQLKCPVLLLAQLSRAVESRQDKRPTMADLRDSGEIEQDADVILFVYRDEVYHPDSRAKGIAEIIIAKQRNGGLGRVGLAFTPELTRFADLPAGTRFEHLSERRGSTRGGFDD